MKTLLSALLLASAMFAPALVLAPVSAAASETCFTKALNGDVIEPPMCFTAKAHETSGDYSCPTGTKLVYNDRNAVCNPVP